MEAQVAAGEKPFIRGQVVGRLANYRPVNGDVVQRIGRPIDGGSNGVRVIQGTPLAAAALARVADP